MISELGSKVSEEVETVDAVEAFLVFAMTAFNLAVVARCVRADELVPDARISGGFQSMGRSHTVGCAASLYQSRLKIVET